MNQVPNGSVRKAEEEGRTRRPWLALTLALSLGAHAGLAAMLWIQQPPQPEAGAVMSIEIVSAAGAVKSGAASSVAGGETRPAKDAAKPETAPVPAARPAPEPPRAAREAPSRSPHATEAPQPPAPETAEAPPNTDTPLRRPAPPAPVPAPAAAETPKPVPPETVVTPRAEAALRPPAPIPSTAAPSASAAAPGPSMPTVLAGARIAAVALRRPARVPPPPANAPRLAESAAPRGTETVRPARPQTASVPIVAADAAPASGPENGTTPPRYGFGSAANPIPRYPETARENGWEGVVMLIVQVGANGEALSISISRSSGHGLLDAAAVDAVRRWRFEPARRGGFAVPGTATVPIRFRLED